MVKKVITVLPLFLLGIFFFNNNNLCPEEGNMNYIRNNTILSQNFKVIGQKKIYFGHQSVGYNIIEGIMDLQKKGQIRLDLVELEQVGVLEKNGFYHTKVGQNKSPLSKIDGFAEQMNSGIGETADMAFFKFCFVDINPDTKITKIFDHYKNTMEELKEKYPQTTFIHFTVPLNRTFSSWKTKLKVLMRKKDIWEYDTNIRKNEYNDLIRQYYKGKEPLFDIAFYESLMPDGSHSSFNRNGKTYFDLAQEYTYDEGHLNEKGRKWIAEHLLSFLTKITQ